MKSILDAYRQAVKKGRMDTYHVPPHTSKTVVNEVFAHTMGRGPHALGSSPNAIPVSKGRTTGCESIQSAYTRAKSTEQHRVLKKVSNKLLYPTNGKDAAREPVPQGMSIKDVYHRLVIGSAHRPRRGRSEESGESEESEESEESGEEDFAKYDISGGALIDREVSQINVGYRHKATQDILKIVFDRIVHARKYIPPGTIPSEQCNFMNAIDQFCHIVGKQSAIAAWIREKETIDWMATGIMQTYKITKDVTSREVSVGCGDQVTKLAQSSQPWLQSIAFMYVLAAQYQVPRLPWSGAISAYLGTSTEQEEGGNRITVSGLSVLLATDQSDVRKQWKATVSPGGPHGDAKRKGNTRDPTIVTANLRGLVAPATRWLSRRYHECIVPTGR
jgi:hypothetical protein